MDCETVVELLGNYIDEELTQSLRSSLEKHVAACSGCTRDLATLQSTVAALKTNSEIEPTSPWFTERLLHRLAQATETSLSPIEKPAENLQLGLW